MSGAPREALASVVPAQAAGLELLAWLVERFRYADAAAWGAALAAGRVACNGEVATAECRLRAGDRIEVRPPDAESVPRLTVLHADAACVVVDKPPYLVAHDASAFAGRAIVPILSAQLGVAPSELRLAHRLDRETSGALLLARSAAASRGFTAQFAAGRVAKRYVALVDGVVVSDTLRVELPIGRAPTGPAERRCAGPEAREPRPACTELRVLARSSDATLVELTPRTGRTHQLRVHLAALGHPLFGDKLYGRSDADYAAYVAHAKAGGDPRWPGVRDALRHLLHAAHLAFDHPDTGAPVVVAAPWPDDLRAICACLGLAP